METQDFQVGDCLIEDKEFYIIVDMRIDALGVVYDIKPLRGGTIIKSIPEESLVYADKVIPAKNMTKFIKILYG